MSMLLLRMTDDEKAGIRRAARQRHQSMNGFILEAACQAVRGTAWLFDSQAATWGREAEDALEALTAAGLTKPEATRRIANVLQDRPEAPAEDILRRAFGQGD